jgi:hypothetical protein
MAESTTVSPQRAQRTQSGIAEGIEEAKNSDASVHALIRPTGYLLPYWDHWDHWEQGLLDAQRKIFASRLSQLTTSYLPRFDDLLNRVFQTDGDIPVRVMLTHFAEVAVVANMVTDAVLIHVGVNLFPASK